MVAGPRLSSDRTGVEMGVRLLQRAASARDGEQDSDQATSDQGDHASGIGPNGQGGKVEPGANQRRCLQ